MSGAKVDSHVELGIAERPEGGFLRELWREFRRNRLASIGMIIFGVFFLIAVSGRFLTYGDNPVLNPSRVRLSEKLRSPLSSPCAEAICAEDMPALGIYLFGTDDLGRDVFARMLQGAWVSLTVGFVAVGIAVTIGVFLGGLAGYFGERPVRLGHGLFFFLLVFGLVRLVQGHVGSTAVLILCAAAVLILSRFASASAIGRYTLGIPIFSFDTLITGMIDIMLCFPTFFLILTVVALLPASIFNIMVVIGLTSWMGSARFVRAEFLSLREQDFVMAVRALGISDLRIIFRHMAPNAIGPVLVSATIGIAGAILTEAGLSFLGFGVPPPHATWGNILSDGKRFLFDAPWLTLIPGVAILIVVLAFNLFGEGLREVMNPRLREPS